MILVEIKYNKPYFYVKIPFRYRAAARKRLNWDKKEKAWKVLADIGALKLISDCIRELKNHDDVKIKLTPEAKDEVQKLKNIIKVQIDTSDFKPKKESMEHQEISSKFAIEKKRAAIFNDTGTGKTKVALDAIEYLIKKRLIRKALIIVPNTLKIKWKKEMEKFTDLTENEVTIINYEIFSRTNPFIDESFDCIVLDEATYIKNPKAKRTQRIKELFHDAPFKFALTATPYTQNTGDVFSIFEFLDGGATLGIKYQTFMHEYNKVRPIKRKDGRVIHVFVPDEDKVRLLMDRIAYRTVAFQKKDVLDLPEEIYDERPLEPPPELLRAHKEFKLNKQLELETDDEDKKLIKIKNLIIKAHQISTGFIQDNDGNVFVLRQVTPKLEAIRDIITEEAYGKKILIWRYFNVEEKLIESFLKSIGVKTLLLNRDTKNPQEVIDKFHDGDGKYVLIASLAAYRFGHNIYADIVVFHSNSFSVETRKQAIDRSVRYGTRSNVVIIDLYYERMLDEYILKCLKRNKNVLDTGIKELKRFLRS